MGTLTGVPVRRNEDTGAACAPRKAHAGTQKAAAAASRGARPGGKQRCRRPVRPARRAPRVSPRRPRTLGPGTEACVPRAPASADARAARHPGRLRGPLPGRPDGLQRVLLRSAPTRGTSGQARLCFTFVCPDPGAALGPPDVSAKQAHVASFSQIVLPLQILWVQGQARPFTSS